MIRRLTVTFMAWLLLAASASAGLGQISVRSHIGEPFNAVVSLNDVSSLAQVRVGLADRATFDDLNVDYEPALAGLRFSLVSGATGPKVLIRSQAPIRSSYLRFVLELKNPPERSVREYTVLLDSFEGDEVKAPQSSAVPHAAKKPAAPAAPAARVSSVRVPPGGTLAGVARQVKPAGVSLQQTMASLYLANPDKFTDRDPLHVQGGARLSVPSAASMRALSPARVRDALRPRNVAASAAHGRPKVVPAEPLPPSVLRKMIKPSEPLHAPVAAQQTPTHGDTAAAPAPAHSASAPVAVDASAAAAEAAKVKALQQQVDARAQDLKKANKHIEDLKLKIKALEASQAHAAEAAKGFWHGKGLVKWGAVAAGALALLLILALVWRRRRAGGKTRPSNPHPLATTGVAPAAPEAAAQGDGDPLAEAEVYLSYGHDEQAEAILVKGLEQNPSRQDIRAKLLEIYAARPDPMRYERLAREVHDAYDGRGAQWERTRAMGQTIDPDNPLYQPEDAAAGSAPAATEPQTVSADASALDDMLNFDMGESVVAGPEAEPVQSEADKDALLNFDFSLDGAASATAAQPQAEAEPESQEEADALAAWEAALGETEAQPAAEPAPAAQPEAEMLAAADADGVAGMGPSAAAAEPEADLTFPDAEAAAVATEPAAAELASAVVDDLPLEVDPMADAPAPEDLHVEMIEHDDPAAAVDDALATKLDLARVYLDMGDNEGAREVLLELQKEAQGPLRQQADDMLAKLL